jgi:hypothetical protein
MAFGLRCWVHSGACSQRLSVALVSKAYRSTRVSGPNDEQVSTPNGRYWLDDGQVCIGPRTRALRREDGKGLAAIT